MARESERRPERHLEAARSFRSDPSSVRDETPPESVEPMLSLRRVGVADISRCPDDAAGEAQAARALSDLRRFPSGVSVRILVTGSRPWLTSLRNVAMIRDADARLRLQLEGDAAGLEAWSRALFEVIE